MKLLFISQYVYRPEQPASNRIYQFLQLLARRGHEPHVIAGGVHYLHDKLDPELERRKLIDTKWGDVPVTLTYAAAGFRSGVIPRLRSYMTFAWYAMRAALRVKRVDAVMVSIQPFFVAPLAWIIARWRRVPFWLEVRDLWPDAAAEIGLVRSRLLLGLGRMLEMFVYRRAERIVVIGAEMKKAIVRKGIEPDRIHVVPQGYEPPPHPADRESARKRLVAGDEFIVMFAGSFGLANNDLPSIVATAVRMKDESGVRFVFIGDGNQKQACIDRCNEAGCRNVDFRPMVSKTEVHDFLAAADACIMTLPPGDFWKICLQNKIFDYMGSGLPVVAAVEGDQKELIERAEGGIVVPPGDVSGLEAAIRRLHADPVLVRRMGDNARAYVRKHLMREKIVSEYVDLLEQWIRGR